VQVNPRDYTFPDNIHVCGAYERRREREREKDRPKDRKTEEEKEKEKRALVRAGGLPLPERLGAGYTFDQQIGALFAIGRSLSLRRIKEAQVMVWFHGGGFSGGGSNERCIVTVFTLADVVVPRSEYRLRGHNMAQVGGVANVWESRRLAAHIDACVSWWQTW